MNTKQRLQQLAGIDLPLLQKRIINEGKNQQVIWDVINEADEADEYDEDNGFKETEIINLNSPKKNSDISNVGLYSGDIEATGIQKEPSKILKFPQTRDYPTPFKAKHNSGGDTIIITQQGRDYIEKVIKTIDSIIINNPDISKYQKVKASGIVNELYDRMFASFPEIRKMTGGKPLIHPLKDTNGLILILLVLNVLPFDEFISLFGLAYVITGAHYKLEEPIYDQDPNIGKREKFTTDIFDYKNNPKDIVQLNFLNKVKENYNEGPTQEIRKMCDTLKTYGFVQIIKGAKVRSGEGMLQRKNVGDGENKRYVYEPVINNNDTSKFKNKSSFIKTKPDDVDDELSKYMMNT